MVHYTVLEDFGLFNNPDFYICGPPIMVDSAVKDLLNHGVKQKNIFYDSFLPSNQ